MTQYKLFSTEYCPKCRLIKNILERAGVAFTVEDMSSPESLAELFSNGVFTMSAPVLQVDDKFYTTQDMFDGEVFKGIEGVDVS